MWRRLRCSNDVLEDTDGQRSELDARFGEGVGALVSLVSDDPGIVGVEERKDDVRERVRAVGGEAAVVYAADKVSKVRELRLVMAREPDNPEIEIRLSRYRKPRSTLDELIPGSRLAERLRFELETLEALPPQPD